jgi:hypothetical protein
MEGWMVILVVAGLLFFWGYGESLASSQKVAERVRRMLHKERLTALEKGLPAPDGTFDEALLAYLAEGGQETLDPRASRRRGMRWGLALIVGGIGWSWAAIMVPGSGPIGWLQDTFSFGIIPILFGVGLLIHALVSKD